MKAMIFTIMPMFVCLFWSFMLAFELHRDGKNRTRLHLLAFMLTATILYMGHCVFFNHKTSIIPLTNTLYCASNLAVYPLYYLYICSLTTRRNHHRFRYIMIIPAIFAFFGVGLIYILMSPEETAQFIDIYLYQGKHEGLTGLAIQQGVLHDICKGMFGILLIPVVLLGRNHLKQYEKQVAEAYADVEDKSLGITHAMLIAFVVTSVFSFVFNIIGRHHFNESIWLLAIPSTLFSVLLFVIGYVGIHQDFCVEDIEKDEEEADETVSELPAIKELRGRIERLMEQEQLYRQPNLKIADVVSRLGTNRNYIYIAINREIGMSFNEYINRMRIDYATMLINQHPTKLLTEISEESGFTSTTSFYRNFKLYKGVGPREYQKMRNHQ